MEISSSTTSRVLVKSYIKIQQTFYPTNATISDLAVTSSPYETEPNFGGDWIWDVIAPILAIVATAIIIGVVAGVVFLIRRKESAKLATSEENFFRNNDGDTISVVSAYEATNELKNVKVELENYNSISDTRSVRTNSIKTTESSQNAVTTNNSFFKNGFWWSPERKAQRKLKKKAKFEEDLRNIYVY